MRLTFEYTSSVDDSIVLPVPTVAVAGEFMGVSGAEVTLTLRSLGELTPWRGHLRVLANTAKAPASLYPEAIEAFIVPRPERQLVTLLVCRDDQLVAAAYLVRHRRAGIWRYAQAGTRGEPWTALAVDPDARARLATAVRAELDEASPRWTLWLPDLASNDPFVGELENVLRYTNTSPAGATPLLKFVPGTSVNTYLSRNSRAAVAKARNRISHDGLDYELRWTSDADEIVDALDDIVTVRRERNEQLHRNPHPGQAGRQEVATFRAMITGLAHAGHAQVLQLRIAGRLASFAVCFVGGETLWVYSNAVSPEFVRYSAGTIVNTEVVRHAYADPAIDVLSWGAGVQRYKLSGNATISEGITFEAWSTPVVRRMVDAQRFVRHEIPDLARRCVAEVRERVADAFPRPLGLVEQPDEQSCRTA